MLKKLNGGLAPGLASAITSILLITSKYFLPMEDTDRVTLMTAVSLIVCTLIGMYWPRK